MNARVASTLAAFKQSVAQLNVLIDAYEATPEAPQDPADVIAQPRRMLWHLQASAARPAH
jgi:hypothetical protein